jgi:nucleotide-binding universal stress UspA family protein
MNGRDDFRAETEARRQPGDVMRPNRFSQMINRYLGAAAYPDPNAPRPAPVAVAQPGQPEVARGLVIAGVDESPISYVAAEHAAIEAELHGWELRLVTVRHSCADDAGAALLWRLTDRVRAGFATVPVTSRLVAGAHPASELLAEAAGADLLVVGHRHGATTTALGHSVADRVGRHHPGTVLVVRRPAWPAGGDFGRRPVVAAVDGSSAARGAVEFALAEARVRGCRLTLLHVARHRTDPARHLEMRDGVPVRSRIISGDPVSALLEESSLAAAVVVGRVRGLLSDSLLRPAAVMVPRRAFCPVFLVG